MISSGNLTSFAMLNGPSNANMVTGALVQASQNPYMIGTIQAAGPSQGIIDVLLSKEVTLQYAVPFWAAMDKLRLMIELNARIARIMDNQQELRLKAIANYQNSDYVKACNAFIQFDQQLLDMLQPVLDDLSGACATLEFKEFHTKVHAEYMYKDVLTGAGLIMATDGNAELHNVPRSSLEGPVVGTKLIYKK